MTLTGTTYMKMTQNVYHRKKHFRVLISLICRDVQVPQ